MAVMLTRIRWLIPGAITVFSIITCFFILTPYPRRVAHSVLGIEKHVATTKAAEFFEWDTWSSFKPVVHGLVANMSLEQLCDQFPTELLSNVQPVLKTGHGVLNRLIPQLHSNSACLENLIILSDLDEQVEGREVFNVLEDIPNRLLDDDSKTYESTAVLRHLRDADDRAKAIESLTREEGHDTDRFKFLATISRAWRMRPERRWYIFYEGDTFVVWDNVFRLLSNFDPDVPQYFGSPSPGRDGTWFANGGPGYIISRAAMRKLVKHDWDAKTGEYLGTKLTERYWEDVVGDGNGDSVLGWALWKEGVPLKGLWPMFNPHPPTGLPFSDLYWCQPILTMHKPREDQMVPLWRWEWEHRALTKRPIIYRDLAVSYFDFTNMTTRQDWDNGEWDAFAPPVPSTDYSNNPHSSQHDCASACDAYRGCFQWTYHLRECWFVRSFRVGRHKEAILRRDDPKQVDGGEWPAEDLRFTAGWSTDTIAKWIDDRPCDQIKWVVPSVERIF